MEEEKDLFIRSHAIALQYQLRFDSENCRFILVLCKQVFEFFSKEFTLKIMEKVSEERSFKKGWLLTSTRWGINGCFTILERKDGYVLLESTLHKKANLLAITATLHHVFKWATFTGLKPFTNNGLQQEVFISSAYDSLGGCYSNALTADLSREFSLWMYHADDQMIAAVNEKVGIALAKAYEVVFKKKPNQRYGGGLYDKRFLLSLPSDLYSCQFAVMGDEANFDPARPFGYKASCHNLDFFTQQLVMLAGFATLCECYQPASPYRIP